ncbi:MAG: transposase [Bacteroidales bacterium]|nr:transposase [Bacteroidales bacterium]MBZ0193660.1 transposase [Candidatus Kapabacteria bacterium]QOJ25869.1 MAG: transposase [Ignavibacteria bacterium]WKZ77389.1 MAG: transposase [Candidatus Kapabacteria bacterium]WKZ78799.1 MAG: transposase [Candidatus Kapabacteria bacterium]
MSRTKRTFTPEDRLSLLQEAEREGYLATCRKYNLSPSLLAKWKQRYLCKGVAGLNPSYRRIDPAVRALEEENERLKRIIARQALELEVKGELLKKTPIQPRRK